MIEQYMQIQKFLQILYNLYNINLTPFTPVAIHTKCTFFKLTLSVGLNPGAKYETECMRNMGYNANIVGYNANIVGCKMIGTKFD